MRNVFIAIGGSGTKVAEAMVRLITLGFPIRSFEGLLTNANDSIEIWRIDPDRNAGCVEDLKSALVDLKQLRELLGDDPSSGIVDGWAPRMTDEIVDIDPLEITSSVVGDVQTKTLRTFLDTASGNAESFSPVLTPFLTKKDLDVRLDRGFHQKPLIGAAVMSVFCDSLADESSPGGRKINLRTFERGNVNFFLCGSLNGGTGSSGVPTVGRFLNKKRDTSASSGWRIGGCLVFPSLIPPKLPAEAAPVSEAVTEELVEKRVAELANAPFLAGLGAEERFELVRQILLGYVVAPETVESRANQALAYFKDQSAKHFDEIYLVGRSGTTQLKDWANGGKTQKNPLTSSDVAAALAALNFFAGSNKNSTGDFFVGSSENNFIPDQMRSHDLPFYKINDAVVQPERVILATALTVHLIKHGIPWDRMHEAANSFKFASFYKKRKEILDDDYRRYLFACDQLQKAISALFSAPIKYEGFEWSIEELRDFYRIASDEEHLIAAVRQSMDRRPFKTEPNGSVDFGNSSAMLTSFDFAEWSPDGNDYTPGEYFRIVWNGVYERVSDRVAA